MRQLPPLPRVRAAELEPPAVRAQEAVLPDGEVREPRGEERPVGRELALLEAPPQRDVVEPLLEQRLEPVRKLAGWQPAPRARALGVLALQQAPAVRVVAPVLHLPRHVLQPIPAPAGRQVALPPHGLVLLRAHLVVAQPLLVAHGLVRWAQRAALVRPLLGARPGGAHGAVGRPELEVGAAPHLAALRALARGAAAPEHVAVLALALGQGGHVQVVPQASLHIRLPLVHPRARAQGEGLVPAQLLVLQLLRGQGRAALVRAALVLLQVLLQLVLPHHLQLPRPAA
mmetsp:Transcript_5038/g.17584  ORF Transcript_5038/g.17584 Transcript_5038/m.17584 type:complete len:286 (-) Transcript_5038:72-929(-)